MRHALALLCAAVTAGLGMGAAVRPTVDTVSVRPTSAALTGPLPSDFASLSYEVPCAMQMFQLPTGDPRTSFVNLMTNLKMGQGPSVKGPNIRVGGNSADESAYVPAPAPLPPNDTYRITDADLMSYATVVPRWNGTVTLGLNFRDASDASLAVAHVNAALNIIPLSLLEAVEVGNECDIFSQNGIRPPTYSFNPGYSDDFALYAAALRSQTQLPMPRVQGATFCCHVPSFDAGLPGYTAQYGGKVASTISYHHYPLDVCNGRPPPSVWALLSDASAQKGAQGVAAFASAAQHVGIPFYIGEGNSVACGGAYNVSNVFAATLWAVDVMFNMAAVGVTRWNFHGCPQGAYTAIAYSNLSSNVPDVRALYYGMWAFSAAVVDGGQVMAANVSSTNPFIKAWVVHSDAAGAWNVVIIHKDGNATSPAAITVTPLAPATQSAQLALLAPRSGGVYASDGISFAGQTFDGSQDGTPSGTRTTTPVAPVAGTYTFTIPPAAVGILSYPDPS